MDRTDPRGRPRRCRSRWPAKRFSGKFVLRVEPALHRRLAAKALAAGESLNSYCVKTLVKA